MGFWNWVKAKSKARPSKGRRSKPLDPNIRRALGRVRRDFKQLETTLGAMDGRLNSQAKTIAAHSRLLDRHTTRLQTLETILAAVPPTPVAQDTATSRPKQPTNRTTPPTSRLVATNPQPYDPADIPELNALSPQERRIVEVFLGHRDMALSYLDIARSLHKSPHTIKNQMRQLNIKSSFFDQAVDAQNKNRFKLKKHLKIETDRGAD